MDAEGGNILNKIPSKTYKVSKYNHLKNLINIHSWPFSLHSTNLLSTVDIRIGPYTEESIGLKSNVSYNKYYPKFSIQNKIGIQSRSKKNSSSEEIEIVNFSTKSMDFVIGLPLNFSRNSYHRGFSLNLSSILLRQNILGENPIKYVPINTNSTKLSLFLRNTKHQSYRQLGPRWGQTLEVSIARKQFVKTNTSGDKIAAKTILYFPGFRKNHSLKLSGNYSQFLTGIDINDLADFGARGYDYPVNFTENILLSANYALPLGYPDIGIPAWVFLKRIRTNFFLDINRSTGLISKNLRRSIGMEFLFDLGVLRYGDIATFPIGIRTSYLIDEKNSSFPIRFNLISSFKF